MKKTFIELVIGDLEEKKMYRNMMKRVNALPKEYCHAFKKIQQYLYNFGTVGCDSKMYEELLDLFSISAKEGKHVYDVIGKDAATFCDDMIRAYTNDPLPLREKLNQEIHDYFHQGGVSL